MVRQLGGQVFLVILFAATGAVAQTTVTTTNGGTANTVPVFTTGSNVENSPISISGSNVGIGMTSPSTLLEIQPAVDGSRQLRLDQQNWSNGFGFTVKNDGNLYIDRAGTSVMTMQPSGNVNVGGWLSSSTGIAFPDGTTQTSASNSGSSTFTTSNSSTTNSISLTLNSVSIPYINFTRWTGTGSVQDNAFAGMFFNSNDQNYDFGIGTGISTTGNQTATNTVVTVTQGGNVGIGTTAPGAALEVNGNVKLTANSGGSITFQDGTTQSTAYTGVTCGGDYAESVDVTGSRTNYEPGDVLVLDPDNPGKMLKSIEAYSTAVSGIYSTKPGTVGRRQTTPKSPDEVPMAVVGIVPAKVSTENGSINVGDLLVTSSTPGYAMKGTDRSRMLGAVVGKAMAKLDSGTGVIEVLVTLQ